MRVTVAPTDDAVETELYGVEDEDGKKCSQHTNHGAYPDGMFILSVFLHVVVG
jgi:hypothetical protein